MVAPDFSDHGENDADGLFDGAQSAGQYFVDVDNSVFSGAGVDRYAGSVLHGTGDASLGINLYITGNTAAVGNKCRLFLAEPTPFDMAIRLMAASLLLLGEVSYFVRRQRLVTSLQWE